MGVGVYGFRGFMCSWAGVVSKSMMSKRSIRRRDLSLAPSSQGRAL